VNIFGQVLVLVYQKENTVNKKTMQNDQSLLMPSLKQQKQTNKQTNISCTVLNFLSRGISAI